MERGIKEIYEGDRARKENERERNLGPTNQSNVDLRPSDEYIDYIREANMDIEIKRYTAYLIDTYPFVRVVKGFSPFYQGILEIYRLLPKDQEIILEYYKRMLTPTSMS